MVLMAMMCRWCPAHGAHEGDGTNKVRASSPGDHPACLQALPPTFTLHTPWTPSQPVEHLFSGEHPPLVATTLSLGSNLLDSVTLSSISVILKEMCSGHLLIQQPVLYRLDTCKQRSLQWSFTVASWRGSQFAFLEQACMCVLPHPSAHCWPCACSPASLRTLQTERACSSLSPLKPKSAGTHSNICGSLTQPLKWSSDHSKAPASSSPTTIRSLVSTASDAVGQVLRPGNRATGFPPPPPRPTSVPQLLSSGCTGVPGQPGPLSVPTRLQPLTAPTQKSASCRTLARALLRRNSTNLSRKSPRREILVESHEIRGNPKLIGSGIGPLKRQKPWEGLATRSPSKLSAEQRRRPGHFYAHQLSYYSVPLSLALMLWHTSSTEDFFHCFISLISFTLIRLTCYNNE